MKLFYLIALIFITQIGFSQNTVKKLEIVKVEKAPKIDGILDDEVWKNAQIATDFVELNPTAGRHEKNEERTEVKIVYDDNAVYVAARMYETSEKKVAHELTIRDNIGNDDFVGIIFDTYLDGINGSGFYVTAAGVQFDAKYGPPDNNGNDEDASWNAVYETKVKIDKQGWTAEFRIPYSALRFPKKDIQTWGINILRKRQIEQKLLFWNEVDPKKNGFINQEGQLLGIKNVNPPLRLAFYPYLATYVNHYPYNTPGIDNTTAQFNGGMDVKYGINQSFTLDVTLIPDFGQVQSDNKILNLTPFEVKYNENRQFFTEGTELFKKGNLFYSRRVGGQPINYYNASGNLAPHESVISNPTESKLVNATKLTGRLANGLGIGFFNALSRPSFATIQDSVTGAKRLYETAPLTNYNIIVLDQNLKNNSAVTFINTNVNRFGKDYNANVGGFVLNLNNKKNTYNLSGFVFRSDLFYPGQAAVSGYNYEVSAGRTSGNFTWNITEDRMDANYSQNDLGIMDNNNFLDHNINFQYAYYKPTKYFTQWGVWSNTYYSRRVFSPSYYQYLNENFGTYFTLKNFWNININGHMRQQGNDFYEPHTDGLFFKKPQSFQANININTNRAKVLSGGVFCANNWLNAYHGYGLFLEPYYNLRLSNKFSFGQDITYNPQTNYRGFATKDSVSGAPIFALRDVKTVENIFNLKYTFNNVIGLTLRVRHYWSKLNNKTFFDLDKTGDLITVTSKHFNQLVDRNYNTWNVDMIYAWEFSPGSQLSIAYKSSSLTDTNIATGDYTQNLRNTYKEPQNNNFSVKVLYYVDYQSLRKKRA